MTHKINNMMLYFHSKSGEEYQLIIGTDDGKSHSLVLGFDHNVTKVVADLRKFACEIEIENQLSEELAMKET